MFRERTPDTKESVAVQAARFSLYAPFAALFVGCFSTLTLRNSATTGTRESGVAIALAVLNIVVITLGFVLGLFALAMMRRYGRKGILWRSITGVALNGLLLYVVVTTAALPIWRHKQTSAQLAGTWHLQSSPSPVPGSSTDLTLRTNGTFSLDISHQTGEQGQLSGKWQLITDRMLVINVESVGPQGDQSTVGKRMGIGRIEQIDATSMTISTDAGIETYRRR